MVEPWEYIHTKRVLNKYGLPAGGGKMLRTNTHKLITYEDDPVIQLFDMEADPWETRNLTEASNSRALASEMQASLTAFESELELAEA